MDVIGRDSTKTKTLLPRVDSKPFKPRRCHTTGIRTAVAAVLCAEHAVPVHASEQPSALQEIEVTATRRQENIQETPYNMAAVNSNMIEQLQMNKIDDVAHWVPGVSIQDQGAYAASNIVVRGLNVSSLGASGGGPNGVGGAVAEYLGEVPLFFDFKLFDIDRVEVLLGPQGTLYGTGTLGGVIRYIPRAPNLSKFELEARARLTSLDGAPQAGYTADAVFNVPLVENTLGFRAVVGYFDDPGFINDTLLVRFPGVSLPQPDFKNPVAVAMNLHTERGVNFDHTFTARATLLYRPNDALDAELSYAHQRTNTDGPETTHAPLLGTGPFDSATRVLGVSERKVDLTGLVVTGHLGFADLVSASSYAQRKIRLTRDATDGFLGDSSYTNFSAFVAIDVFDENRDQVTEELRLVSASQGRFKWIVGGFYEYFEDNFIDHTYVPGYPTFVGINRPDQLNSYSNTLQRFSDKALFAELGYQFTTAWQVTVGGRWFKDQIDGTLASAFPLVDGSPPDGLNLKVTDLTAPSADYWLYKVNTSLRFTPDLLLYATVSDGYRSGGINVAPPCPPGITTNCLPPDERTWKPDRTRNYELGVRSTWFDKRLTLNAAAYYIKWTDLRVSAKNRFGASYLTNGSSALSQGIEMELQAQLPARLQLLGTVTYNDAKMTAPALGLLRDLNGTYDAETGDRLPGSPRTMGSVHIRYLRNLPDGYALAADYGIAAQSNMYSTIGLRASGEEIPGYAVHEASLGLSKDNWSATFFVQNLLNKYANTGVAIDLSYKNQIVDGVIGRNYYHSVLQPRQFGLEVRMSLAPH